jgi:hypothetical protein
VVGRGVAQNSIQRGAWTASRLRRVHDDLLLAAHVGEEQDRVPGEATTNGVT